MHRAELQEAAQLHRAGRLPQAERIYRRVLEQDPRNACALRLLGLVASDSGNPSAAVNLMRRSLAIEPNSAETYCNLVDRHP